MISLGNLLGEFKKWLDGEESAAIEAEPPRVRREWEEFLHGYLRAVAKPIRAPTDYFAPGEC